MFSDPIAHNPWMLVSTIALKIAFHLNPNLNVVLLVVEVTKKEKSK